MTRQRDYVFSEQGPSDKGGSLGNYCFRPGVNSWSPPYQNGVLTFRMFPALSPEDPNEFDPYRWAADDAQDALGFGDWVRRYPAVRGIGTPSVTYLYDDPAAPLVEDMRMTPAWVLYNAVQQAIAQKQERQGWASLLQGSPGRGAQLPKPAELYLVHGCVLMWRNNIYMPVPRGIGEEDDTTVIALSPSAGTAMLQQCHLEVEGYTGNPDDFESRYVNGDPVSLDTGRFVTIYSLSDGDPRKAQQVQTQGWQTQRTAGGVGDVNDQKQIGYGCFMSPEFNGLPAGLRLSESAVRSKVKPWKQVVNVLSLEKQANLIADKFPADLIQYAWGDSHPDWIPADVARRAVAAMSVPVGGIGVPPAVAAGMAAAPYAGGAPPAAGVWPASPATPAVAPGTPQAFAPAVPQTGPVTAEAAAAAAALAANPAAATAPIQPAQGASWPTPAGGAPAPPFTPDPAAVPADAAVPPGAIPAGAVVAPVVQAPPQVPASAAPTAATVTPAENLQAVPGNAVAAPQIPAQQPVWPSAPPAAAPLVAAPPAAELPAVAQPVAQPVAAPPVAQPVAPAVAAPPVAPPLSSVFGAVTPVVPPQQPVQPQQAPPPQQAVPQVDPTQMSASQAALARAQAARAQQ